MAYAVAIIGSNFGDEGKGLMTDYFCKKSKSAGERCLVICHNGGAQRGHTVELKDGTRHVFHHFGSGTFAGADTYLSKDFILNPIIFEEESKNLSKLGFIPRFYINKRCRWSTPYDMFVNQIIEESRGDKRHGSCGAGIWETVVRYENSMEAFNTYFEDICDMSVDDIKAAVDYCRCYAIERLKFYGITEVPDEWKDLMYSKDLENRFIDSVRYMIGCSKVVDDSVLNEYDCLVFESGQGLLLDKNNIEYGNNTTPSNTGFLNVSEISKSVPNLEYGIACYVTRTYLTRHGAGRFDEECDYREINLSLYDETNVENPFQGKIRYGKLDEEKLFWRIEKDFNIASDLWKKALAVTHVNEYAIDVNSFAYDFDEVYISDSRFGEDVREFDKVEL